MKAHLQFFLVTFLLIFATSWMNVNGQNLVQNNGFEVQDTCPQVGEISLAHPWNSPTAASPDLYNILCSSQNEDPRTGIGCAGIFVFDTIPEYREYIQGKLAPLLPGQSYCVSFWVKTGPFRYAVNKLGAYFYTGNIHLLDSTYLPANPQVKNPTGHMLSSATWEEISGSFEAVGNEDHIMIGNFNKDNQTDTVVVNDSVNIKASYYFIDDISVVDCITGIEHFISELEINISPSPASISINVQVPLSVNIEHLELFTSAGHRVIDLAVVNNGLHESLLDIKKCPSGFYFLSVQTNLGVVLKKVVIVK